MQLDGAPVRGVEIGPGDVFRVGTGDEGPQTDNADNRDAVR